jgi:hypothetical protein
MDDYSLNAALRRTARISARIERLLHGISGDEQGAILANLLSLWVASHFVAEEMPKENRPETDAMRELLLQMHFECVRATIPEHEKAILERERERDHEC